MKRHSINNILCAGTVFGTALLCGCGVVTPPPISDANAPAIAEPISFWGEWYLFSEQPDTLRVKIRNNASDAIIGSNIAEHIERNIAKYNAAAALKESESCDVVISFESKYKEMTAAPKCRMYNTTAIEIISSKGEKICSAWENKTESQSVFPDASNAQKAMSPAILNGVDTWLNHTFADIAQKQLGVSILRFKMSKSLIELDPNSFEKEFGQILSMLRKIDGVREVRLIEAEKNDRIASFRVVFHKDKCPEGLAKIINSAK